MKELLVAGLLLAVLLGYALLWARILRLSLPLTLISACCGIICILYFGALAGVLAPTQFVVFWGGIFALLIWLWRTPRPAMVIALWQPGTILFVLAFAWLFFITRGLLLIHWDEFSQWGASAKALVITDHLPTALWSTVHLVYPPGDALFLYFVTKPLGYAEDNLLFAHAIFQLATLLPFFAIVRWRDAGLGIAFIVIGFVAGYFVGQSYANWTSLLVDSKLAFLVASAAAIYFFGGSDTRAMLCAAPVVIALAIIKDVGLLLAMMFACLVICEKAAGALWTGVSASVRQTTAGSVAAYALLAIGPIGVSILWGAYLQRIGVPRALDASWSKALKRSSEANFFENLQTIVSKIAAAVAGEGIVGSILLNFPGWLAIVLSLAALSIALQPSNRQQVRFLTTHLVLAMFLVIYVAALLYVYAVAFDPYEALQIAGFGRYVGTFLLAWMIIAIVLIVHDHDEAARRFVITPVVALIAVGAVYLTSVSARQALTLGPRGDDFSQQNLSVRKTVKDRLSNASVRLAQESTVFSIWNGTTGLPHYISLFELRPRRTNFWCFSLGEKRFADDVWSCDWSAAQLRGTLRSYDFVFLGAEDEKFWQRYESLFAPGARQSGKAFFRVDKSQPDGLLHPIAVD